VSAGLGILVGLSLPSLLFLLLDLAVAYVVYKACNALGMESPGAVAAASMVALPLLMQLSMALMVYAVGAP